MKIVPHEKFKGVFWIKGQKKELATLNLVRGYKNYTEDLIRFEGKEFRTWSHHRSKPAAAIMKGLKNFPIKPGMKVLYLGVASGTTASHFSDIVGNEGIVYGVEVSDRSIRDLKPVAEKRGNIIPILANARKPQEYDWIEQVDLVYEDVASDDQGEILIRNCKHFLKPMRR